MFPYIQLPDWHFGPFGLHPFGPLVAIGIAVSFQIAVWRAKRWGVAREAIAEMCLWIAGVGFVTAHLARIPYLEDPVHSVLSNPLFLMQIFNGQASFGGFLGGALGAWIFFRRRKLDGSARWKLLDAIGFAIPFGWFFGRVGCYLVHDHPGLRTASWLGVKYPGGARFDLGLIEALFLILLGASFVLLARSARPAGFFFGAFLAIYGAFRVCLDQLHVDPPRYAGISVDQWAYGAATLAGVAALALIFRTAREERSSEPCPSRLSEATLQTPPTSDT